MGVTTTSSGECPDCGRPLHSVCDYPANELWCVRCGNRYFANVSSSDREHSEELFECRVLLLDESSNRRDMLVRQLTRLGHQVTPVCHARQALEAASFRRFHVVVLPATISEFPCASFVDKLKHLLGCIKFIVLVEWESQIDGLRDAGLSCAKVDATDCHELEQQVEQWVDGMGANRRPRSGDLRAKELVGVG